MNIGMLYSTPGNKQFAHNCCLLEHQIKQVVFLSMIKLRTDGMDNQPPLTQSSLVPSSMEPMYVMAPMDINANENMYALTMPITTDFNLDGTKTKILKEVQHPTFYGAKRNNFIGTPTETICCFGA